ncbi:asparagine synthase-related protein [Phaeobacter inhibens]|nr:asparagine synthetase B family protein [Phaeobacter inhibens]WHP70459.1 asparagine synthase-related protein [Phaeobacter inhibens]
MGACRLHTSGVVTAGAQPASSPCGRYVYCFNGAIYRYRTSSMWLNIEKADSDTEVIGRMLESIGVKRTLDNLDGMFALIVLDLKEGVVTAARDPNGIKPLFYGEICDGVVLIASDTKCFSAARGEIELEQSALLEYLQFGYNPLRGSIQRGVSQVRPGGSIVIGRDLELRKTCRSKETVDFELMELRENSVEDIWFSLASNLSNTICSAATKPVLAVSSGVDSLALATVASQELDVKLDAYFLYSDKQSSEADLVERNMRKLGHNLCRIEVSDPEVVDAMSFCIRNLGDPLGDMSVVPTHILSSEMAKDGVRIAFGGDGADELFFGYNRYWKILAMAFENNDLLISEVDDNSFFTTSSQGIIEFSKIAAESRGYFVPRNGAVDFMKDYLLALSVFDFDSFGTWRDEFQPCRLAASEELGALQMIRLMGQWDRKYYLSESVLRKTDRAFMANSIEYRVPFLSGEFCVSSGVRKLFGADPEKSILRNVVRRAGMQLEFVEKQGFLIDLSSAIRSNFSITSEESKVLSGLISRVRPSNESRAQFSLSMLFGWASENNCRAEVLNLLK